MPALSGAVAACNVTLYVDPLFAVERSQDVVPHVLDVDIAEVLAKLGSTRVILLPIEIFAPNAKENVTFEEALVIGVATYILSACSFAIIAGDVCIAVAICVGDVPLTAAVKTLEFDGTATEGVLNPVTATLHEEPASKEFANASKTTLNESAEPLGDTFHAVFPPVVTSVHVLVDANAP